MNSVSQIHEPEFHALHANQGLSMLLTMYLFERMQAGIFGGQPTPPRCLLDDTRHTESYCLDAPDLMPAGGMLVFEFGDAADEWIAEQITTNREGGAA